MSAAPAPLKRLRVHTGWKVAFLEAAAKDAYDTWAHSMGEPTAWEQIGQKTRDACRRCSHVR